MATLLAAAASPRGRAAGLGLLASLPILHLHATGFLPFVADDAFLSLRYAERLATGRGLTFNDGEAVEGYSNLLWVLLEALGIWLGGDGVWVMRTLGCLSTLGCFVALAWAGRGSAWTVAVPLTALALSSPVAVWSSGGLEAPLFALAWLLSAAGVAALADGGGPWLRAGTQVALGALVLTRPEGVAIAALTVLTGVVLARGRAARLALLGCLVTPLVVAALQLVFRRVYYGDWVPNTAYAKLALTEERWALGFRAVRDSLHALSPVVAMGALGFVACLFDRGLRRRAPVALVPALAWLGYVASIGGDIVPARRHFVPVLVLAAWLAVLGLGVLSRYRWPGRAALALSVISLLPLCWLSLRDREAQRAREERWEWEALPVARLWRQHLAASPPLVAVDAAGALPYFTRFPTLDMLGLTDREIARRRPRDMGKGPLAHELGDAASVLARRPDLVVFGTARGSDRPRFRGGRELAADPTFQREYVLLWFESSAPEHLSFQAFARRSSARLGAVFEEDRVRLPGFLLATRAETPAVEDPRGKLGALCRWETPLNYSTPALEPGEWTLDVEPRDARALVSVEGDATAPARGAGSLRFLVERPAPVRIDVRPSETRLLVVTGLSLVRARARAEAPRAPDARAP